MDEEPGPSRPRDLRERLAKLDNVVRGQPAVAGPSWRYDGGSSRSRPRDLRERLATLDNVARGQSAVAGPSRRNDGGRASSSSRQSFNQHRSRSLFPHQFLDRSRPWRTGSSETTNNCTPQNLNKNNGPGQRIHRPNTKQQQRFPGFKLLEEIAQCENEDILVKINQRKDAFFNLLKSPIVRPDIFVLVTELMAKISQSSFSQIKMQILKEICVSPYLGSFQKYLMDLPYMSANDISANSLYWKDQEGFWVKFVTFCECLVTFLPATTLQKCRSMIEDSSKLCLEKLAERHEFKLSDQCSSRLYQLRERLVVYEKEMKDKCHKKQQVGQTDAEPPEMFRELDVIPDSEELLGRRPFLRPNIIKGGYENKDHYLDVQYRLLREDCFGPLREGLRQYIAEPNKGKFDHIRVYNNVRFVGPYIPKTKDNIGSMVQVDVKSKKWPKRINWGHSKRFLFGSLVLFTRDKCNSFIVATLLEREVRLLERGMFAVTLMNTPDGENIYDGKPYVMIESEVYFEPYFQVLNALKAPDFPEHVAMEEYIVNVNPKTSPPAYLKADKKFKIRTETTKIAFKVLDDVSWPDKDDLGFDESQYEAYKLALTHEFVVIQGPPGTGKTFIGVKVAQALLENLQIGTDTEDLLHLQIETDTEDLLHLIDNEDSLYLTGLLRKHDFSLRKRMRGLSYDTRCLLLVICYTNHALDQFLEALLPITDSIVRIGGRSRNEAMEKINLKSLRQERDGKNAYNFMMREKKRDLRRAVHELENALDCLDIINDGVLTYESVENFVPEIRFLGEYYNSLRGKDPLKYWLFERCLVYMDWQPIQWDKFQNSNADSVEEDTNRRNKPILDDFEGDDCEVTFDHQSIKGSFTLNTAESQIIHFTNIHRTSGDARQKHQLEQEVREINCQIKLFKEMTAFRKNNIYSKIYRWTNFNVMKPVDRWKLYFRWANEIAEIVKQKIPALQEAMKKAIDAYEESRMIVDLELLKGTKVIGMTTSGAARMRKLLQALGPPIVIVEEAAEVLEAHIVTSLTKNCQHLILIGDHQQLRPSISNLKLVRQYNTNVSLFERMIMNGIKSRRLGVQHRMRPEIAALISPHIYPDLQNHPSVRDFPNVLGMTTNLFFFTHEFQEQEVDDSSSRTNHEEADLTIALANYLIQQGYDADDVTILTTYKGQMFYLRKQREKYLLLSDIKITVVDNYQGEESKIILLSLVRNNPDNNVGFLKIDNRICVALSRAKEGLYIFGNIETLKSNSDLWKTISETLETCGSLGKTLTLKCENHPEKMASISIVEDFDKFPEGGCGVNCDFQRPCGHKCPRTCHVYDKEHTRIKCLESCERALCDLGHKCPLECGDSCQPCEQIVEKMLPCGHNKDVACHLDPTNSNIKCNVELDVILPDCGHKATKSCHLPLEKVDCSEKCVFRVDPCGHRCGRKCHVNDDPEHEKLKRVTYDSSQDDGRLREEESERGASGACVKRMCTEPCNQVCPPCNRRCEINCSCGIRCIQLCGVPCSICPEPCTRKCRHGACKRRCGEPCSRPPCDEPCARRLPCGHRCRGLCGEPCPDICNICRPEDFPTDFLGDKYGDDEKFIKLHDCSHTIELESLDAWIKKDPDQVKIPDCPICRKSIVNTYRYKDIINKMFKDEINPIKERVYGNPKKIGEQKKTLHLELKKCRATYKDVIQENTYWKKAYYILNTFVKSQKKVSLLKLEMQLQYLNILGMIGKCYMTYKNAKLTHLKNEFTDITNILCLVLNRNVAKISQQQQKDIGNEIKRMNSIIQFSKILNHTMYTATIDFSKDDKSFPPEVFDAIKAAREVVLTWKRYDEEDALKALSKLQDVVKVSGIATKLERALVVKAIGLKAGHWFKCENGHFYCIGECGGATHTSRCIGCKAVVGGANHRPAPGNRHAPEMDGSKFAAYSEEYNNMANFNLG